jgi:hypothetical protein
MPVKACRRCSGLKAVSYPSARCVHGDVTVVCVLVMTPVTLLGAVKLAFNEPFVTPPLNR